jgi:hypothetical protein
MFNRSCKICLTIFLSILAIPAIIWMPKHWSFPTISLVFWRFSSVFDVERCPGCSSPSAFSRPSTNHLCHSETH